MLNSAEYNNFSDLVSVYLKVFAHLKWNFQYFQGIQQVLNFYFQMFRILEILNFHPWIQKEAGLSSYTPSHKTCCTTA